MTGEHDIATVSRLFREHIRSNYRLTDLAELASQLPLTPAGLQHLQVMCMHEARVELARGRQTEVSRLSGLAQQLQQYIERASKWAP